MEFYDTDLMAEQFEAKAGRIPQEIIDVIRHIVSSPTNMESDDQNPLTDSFDSEDISAAYDILSNLPTDQDIKSTIISLANNPDNPRNQDLLFRNPALLRAFPIFKQLYAAENPDSDTFYEDRKKAVEDFKEMFGEENLPEKFTKKGKLAGIESRLAELTSEEEKQNRDYRQWDKNRQIKEMHGGDYPKSGDVGFEFIKKDDPLDADAEVEKDVKLREEIGRLREPDSYEESGALPPKVLLPLLRWYDENKELKRGYNKDEPQRILNENERQRRLDAENEALKRGYAAVPPMEKEVEQSLERQKQKPEDNINEQYNPSGFTREGRYFSDVQSPEITRRQNQGQTYGDHSFKQVNGGLSDMRPLEKRPSQNQAAVPPMEEAYDPDGVTSERGRDLATIQKDIAITEALENGDYEKVKEIEKAYKKYERLPTDDTDDYSYMGFNRQRGGLVGYQEGGGVPLEADPAYNEPDMGFVGTPEEGAMDQLQAAQNGEMGGDNVETEVPEGSFVLNSYAVELAGIKDIESLIDDAKKFVMGRMGEEGFATQTETGEDVEVRVSEGEYIIPPALVRIIGRDRLEKINKRGIVEFERQQAEETEMGGQEMPQGPQQPQGFMPPQEGGVPMPAEVPPEQMQGFAIGGGVQQQQPRMITIGEDTLKAALASKPHTPPKPKQQQMAQAPKQRVAQPPRQRAVQQRQQPVSPLTPVNPMAPGAQNLQNTNMRMANMGGFIPYSRNG